MGWRVYSWFMVGFAGLAWWPLTIPVRGGVDDYRLVDIRDITPTGGVGRYGGAVAWSPDGEWIAFDLQETDGFADVYRMHPDGSGIEPLTKDHPDLPNRHQGNPAWHPGGRWLLFQVEKGYHAQDTNHHPCRPGGGYYNDLYVMDLSSSPPYAVYRLTDVRAGYPAGGSLHAHFSPDGSRLLWADLERHADNYGDWRLAWADFVATSVPPVLTNITFAEPATVDRWYETHGWGPDGSWIYFSGTDRTGMNDNAMDICRMDLNQTDDVIRLTFSSGTGSEPAFWDEHAHLSPLGDVFCYVSSDPYQVETGTDYGVWLRTDVWMMNSDGTEHRRITWFNETGGCICADSSWSPAGNRLALRMVEKSTTNVRIKVLEFERSPTIESVIRSNDVLRVRFPAVGGCAYHLECSDDLCGSGWKAVATETQVEAACRATLQDPGSPASKRFVRVVGEPVSP